MRKRLPAERGTTPGKDIMNDTPRLHDRLRSCLQAILELEADLERTSMAEPLLAEFSTLKNIYGKLETLFIQENDVRRIENATAHFLDELCGALPQRAAVREEQRLLQ